MQFIRLFSAVLLFAATTVYAADVPTTASMFTLVPSLTHLTLTLSFCNELSAEACVGLEQGDACEYYPCYDKACQIAVVRGRTSHGSRLPIFIHAHTDFVPCVFDFQNASLAAMEHLSAKLMLV